MVSDSSTVGESKFKVMGCSSLGEVEEDHVQIVLFFFLGGTEV